MKTRIGEIKKVVEVLKNGGVVVLPTDTIYGVSCSALNKNAIERVYSLRKRDLDKPCIILISKLEQLEEFGIEISSRMRSFFEKIWPGKVSVILPIPSSKQEEFEFLHRGKGSLGFRLPNFELIGRVIDQVGPLISTSANVQGFPFAKNTKEAREYFGSEIDFFLDVGELRSTPSSLVSITEDKLEILREGETELRKFIF
ncbi:threonylcarbamoyl-AMP synthase [bacterium]|jgi:L-threonylcarbamoyladenylate synthase|nr:threonylcarbamoyl-AMP synthase [bacterium]MBT4251239.1 threonylcarbamoyl-AMP synthase [bacterium]MBT4598380.1 threonylcarbamoyl-AMP synthase [bacterium]MBT6754213.1 threonylcarbamoyl-AMP synthase [bacterium]MBT7038016.1 threonylcarbamoyl-AMP synthase [bacterium]